MPNKRTHQRITTAVLVALGPPSFLFLSPLSAAAFSTGIAVTLNAAFTPDLDINTRKFGWLEEMIGLKSYAEMVPHRFGLRRNDWYKVNIWRTLFFSHVPFLGTLPRTLMACIFIFPLLMIFPDLARSISPVIFFLWLGMGISDTVHVLADAPEILRGEWPDEKNRRIRMRKGLTGKRK